MFFSILIHRSKTPIRLSAVRRTHELNETCNYTAMSANNLQADQWLETWTTHKKMKIQLLSLKVCALHRTGEQFYKKIRYIFPEWMLSLIKECGLSRSLFQKTRLELSNVGTDNFLACLTNILPTSTPNCPIFERSDCKKKQQNRWKFRKSWKKTRCKRECRFTKTSIEFSERLQQM